MSGLSHREKILFGNSDAIVLLRGKDKVGALSYAYVVMNKQQYAEAIDGFKLGTEINLSDYKRIITSGPGVPSIETREFMEEVYGFKHDQ